MRHAADNERVQAENGALQREPADAALPPTASDAERRLALIARASADLVLRQRGEGGVAGLFRDVAQALGYELMFHYEDDGQALRLIACDGLPDPEREAFATIAMGEHLCGRVAQARQALGVEDLPRSRCAEAAALCSAGVQSNVGVPLIAGRARAQRTPPPGEAAAH